MTTEEVILLTITGKKLPLERPENVTSAELPTGLTVIVVAAPSVVTAPIYIASYLILLKGKEATVPTVVAKSG